VPPWALAVVAMLSVQLSSALSVNMIAAVGPAGTAWLRLSMGALIFMALARPPLRAIRRRECLDQVASSGPGHSGHVGRWVQAGQIQQASQSRQRHVRWPDPVQVTHGWLPIRTVSLPSGWPAGHRSGITSESC